MGLLILKKLKFAKPKIPAFICLSIALILYIWVWLSAEWPEGGQDSWNHYLFARYSWIHPHLFLDQWAKPFFTLLASPFAQFGLNGVIFFNIFCTFLTAWILFRTAQQLGYKIPWYIVWVYLCIPIVFSNTISALTEPLNALAFAGVCYFFSKNRYDKAVLLGSLLPYFRSEGFLLLIAILFYIIVRRKWKSLLWLPFGTLFFSMIGALVSGDLLWILHANPYIKQQVEGAFRPSGSFWHYLHAYKSIIGLPLLLFLAAGLLIIAALSVRMLKKISIDEKGRLLFWFITPVLLGYFFTHSAIWKWGMFGSHGLTRVFVVVAPCFAFITHYAIDKIWSFDIKWIRNVGLSLISVLFLGYAFDGSGYKRLFKGEPSVYAFPGERNILKAMQFLDSSNWRNDFIVHQLPHLNALMNKDPWANAEDSKTGGVWSLDPKADYFPDTLILFWDGFHAVRDANVPLDSVYKLKVFKPIKSFKYYSAEGKRDSIYDIILFRRTEKMKVQ